MKTFYEVMTELFNKYGECNNFKFGQMSLMFDIHTLNEDQVFFSREVDGFVKVKKILRLHVADGEVGGMQDYAYLNIDDISGRYIITNSSAFHAYVTNQLIKSYHVEILHDELKEELDEFDPFAEPAQKKKVVKI